MVSFCKEPNQMIYCQKCAIEKEEEAGWTCGWGSDLSSIVVFEVNERRELSREGEMVYSDIFQPFLKLTFMVKVWQIMNEMMVRRGEEKAEPDEDFAAVGGVHSHEDAQRTYGYRDVILLVAGLQLPSEPYDGVGGVLPSGEQDKIL
jgi:hypothetical protein